jgi:hypothetical protein
MEYSKDILIKFFQFQLDNKTKIAFELVRYPEVVTISALGVPFDYEGRALDDLPDFWIRVALKSIVTQKGLNRLIKIKQSDLSNFITSQRKNKWNTSRA